MEGSPHAGPKQVSETDGRGSGVNAARSPSALRGIEPCKEKLALTLLAVGRSELRAESDGVVD
jgi:hypothetical protein